MKNRCLVTLLATAIVLGLCATSTSQSVINAPQVRKSARKSIAACGLYAKFSYITGWFKDFEGSGRFSREGMAPGATCVYRPRGLFSFWVGAEFYFGNLDFRLQDEEYDGSFSYLEGGFKEWVKVALNLYSARIGLTAGAQKTGNRQIKVNSLEVQLEGSSFDITDFATEHMKNTGNLEIWEIGVDATFPFNKKMSFTFGLQWQRYIMSTRSEMDASGREILLALEIDADRLNLDYNQFADFIYLTPGVVRCGKKLCVSFSVPWAVFSNDVGSWGMQAKIGYRF